MKYTLFLTRRCNLACHYCYVGKVADRMSPQVAGRVINFAFENTPASEDIEIDFFGGEPLLEFPLLKEITFNLEADPRYDPRRVKVGLATNGTLLTLEMLEFFKRHCIGMTISCDGPPPIQDSHRPLADGSGSSRLVEQSILSAVSVLGRVPLNAVFGPDTVEHLARTVEYFSSLGVRQIFLNPDFSARWTEKDVEKVPQSYRAVADAYMQYYREGRPHFISLLDHKITIMLRRGHQPLDKCRMGKGEFAFTPPGDVYPCERLAASDPHSHVVGKVGDFVNIGPLRDHFAPGPPVNVSCLACGIREYCVHWCGCSNYFMTGYYNRVSPFLCMSEQTSLRLAAEIFQTLELELGPTFVRHFGDGLRTHKQNSLTSGMSEQSVQPRNDSTRNAEPMPVQAG
jgi:uncharacterized protein